ncbi:MAG TPA: tRNA (adenosine(37)-N6)-threonylcarbamoyltransferase complex dimerization subunit type 1 TsaB [Gemmatimonadales bacterium]|nr:tRNA (adenosine(37)-N6)-threonylcarbamoyltransferase complex dimerization subunit type 1 TsaB [Gemmatimonadales bacterium]
MLLAIDTATDRASVALGGLGMEATEESVTGARRHAAALLPMIERLLCSAGASLDDLRGIVLSDGPGSFTGLRVGASLAKALVQARNLPLWVAASLLARAAGVAEEGALVLAVAGALRGEVYAAAYRFGRDGVQTVLSPTVRRPDELAASSFQPDVLVGEAPVEVIAALEKWIGRRIIGPPNGSPRASQLLRLVGLAGGARLVEAAQWEPVYGRPAEAQARWEIAHGRPLPDSVGSPG